MIHVQERGITGWYETTEGKPDGSRIYYLKTFLPTAQ
jgi:hypothetical protein